MSGLNTTESMLENSNRKELKCPNCGGILEVEGLENQAVCPFCDSEFEVVTDDDAKVDLIKFKTIMENEKEEKKYAREKEEREASERRGKEFKKSRLGKVMLILAVISILVCISAFGSGAIIKGILAAIQSACFVMAYLIGSEKMKESFKNQYAACIIAGLVLIAPVLCIGGGGSSTDYEKIEWNSLTLSSMLPEPESNKADVLVDSESELDVEIGKTDEEAYKVYVSECKEMGYTVDTESSDSSFKAFNEDGYCVDLYFWESSESMDIDLTAPKELGTLNWPDNGPASLLPEPKSETGEITEDSSLCFSAYVGDMDKESFNDYVAKCKKKGFTEDYYKDDNSFSAENSDGAELDVTYEGNSVMYISIDVPEEVEEQKTEEKKSSKESSKKKSESSKVSEDFKETMDDYEDFFDEYVDFLDSYDESDLSMVTEYASMMTKYYEVTEELEDIDEDELSDADYAYYVEVMARIDKKLLEVGEEL